MTGRGKGGKGLGKGGAKHHCKVLLDQNSLSLALYYLFLCSSSVNGCPAVLHHLQSLYCCMAETSLPPSVLSSAVWGDILPLFTAGPAVAQGVHVWGVAWWWWCTLPPDSSFSRVAQGVRPEEGLKGVVCCRRHVKEPKLVWLYHGSCTDLVNFDIFFYYYFSPIFTFFILLYHLYYSSIFSFRGLF